MQAGIVARVTTDQPDSVPTLPTAETRWTDERIEAKAIPPQSGGRILLPIILFAATCASTWLVGGLAFSLALMTTLLAHELGHYIQARRYGVPASLPYFIPMPMSPIGTMGAVILMQPGMGNRRTLFDIAVTRPIAGLVPALLSAVIGLQWSQVVELADQRPGLMFGEPILFKLLAY